MEEKTEARPEEEEDIFKPRHALTCMLYNVRV